MWLQARERRPGHARDSGLPRSPKHYSHGSLYGAVAGTISGILEGLNAKAIHGKHQDLARNTLGGAHDSAHLVDFLRWTVGAVVLYSDWEVAQRNDAMNAAKQDALDAISRLPEDVDMDEIMYRLYVLDKVRRGREDVAKGRTITREELQREIEAW